MSGFPLLELRQQTSESHPHFFPLFLPLYRFVVVLQVLRSTTVQYEKRAHDDESFEKPRQQERS